MWKSVPGMVGVEASSFGYIRVDGVARKNILDKTGYFLVSIRGKTYRAQSYLSDCSRQSLETSSLCF